MYQRLFSVPTRIKYLFRADSHTPDQIHSKNGFLCRDPYANLDVKSHVIYGGASNFISTSLTIPGALHNIKVASLNDLIAYRMDRECLVEEVANSRLPVHGLGEFHVRVFTSELGNLEHVVLQKGEVDPEKPVLVRVHSEC